MFLFPVLKKTDGEYDATPPSPRSPYIPPILEMIEEQRLRNKSVTINDKSIMKPERANGLTPLQKLYAVRTEANVKVFENSQQYVKESAQLSPDSSECSMYLNKRTAHRKMFIYDPVKKEGYYIYIIDGIAYVPIFSYTWSGKEAFSLFKAVVNNGHVQTVIFSIDNELYKVPTTILRTYAFDKSNSDSAAAKKDFFKSRIEDYKIKVEL